MTIEQRRLMLLNALGGAAVLLSYAYLALVPPEVRGGLWGGLPESLKTPYTVTMLMAAAGYFPLTYQLVFRTKIESDRFHGVPLSQLLLLLYGLVLIPSAAWLPMTAAMITAPSPELWAGVRLVLGLVGIGTGGLLWIAVEKARRDGDAFGWAAAIGAFFFFLQTGVLDAIVWPAYFPL